MNTQEAWKIVGGLSRPSVTGRRCRFNVWRMLRHKRLLRFSGCTSSSIQTFRKYCQAWMGWRHGVINKFKKAWRVQVAWLRRRAGRSTLDEDLRSMWAITWKASLVTNTRSLDQQVLRSGPRQLDYKIFHADGWSGTRWFLVKHFNGCYNARRKNLPSSWPRQRMRWLSSVLGSFC